MRTVLACSLLAALAAPVMGQSTGRTMQLLAPAVVGQTATFGMTYPAAATGNLYAFLWCAPPFAGTTTLSVPGFTLQGVILVDPATSLSAFTGILGAAGVVSHPVAIPNHPSFVGYAWDLQSIDLEAATSTLWFADNELTVSISNLPPTNMVPIAPGTFLMGSNAVVGGPYGSVAWEHPVHQVTIRRPFWISRCEVTQAEYQAVMGSNPSYYQGASYPNSASRPVEMVSWAMAVTYCDTLTAIEAAAGRLPSGYAYRLPTEAEWEYCCRAGTTTEFCYGASLGCSQARIFTVAQTGTYCTGSGSAPVGSFAPNAWGLYDVHGNVWEWCLDSWDGTVNYPSTPVVDPWWRSGANRAVRGGSWGNDANYSRSAYRFGYLPAFHASYIGIRPVLAPVLP